MAKQITNGCTLEVLELFKNKLTKSWHTTYIIRKLGQYHSKTFLRMKLFHKLTSPSLQDKIPSSKGLIKPMKPRRLNKSQCKILCQSGSCLLTEMKSSQDKNIEFNYNKKVSLKAT